MASGNRVEELESRVNELEATVDGLTDELVECKVRIRELENIVDDAGGIEAIEGMAEDASEPGSDQTTEEEIIEPTEEAPADTPKSEADDDADNTESDSESSDIIIA